MHRSIATVSLSGTLRQKLEAIAAARFDGIELFEPDFIQFAGSARELRQITGDLGLSIDLYQPFRDFEGMPDAQFKRSLERAERKFDLMQELGVPLVLVCSNTSQMAINDADLAAEQLRELADRAARRNLRIGFEALAWGRHVHLYRQAWNIVRKADHPHLGLILDSFHTLSLNDDLAGIAQIPGDKIFFLQMADAPRLAMDVLQWARHYRNFPGQGQFDCENFFEQTLRAGYSGPLSLEIFNDIFRETPNRRTATDAMRSLLYLESQARRHLDEAAATHNDQAALTAGQRTELFDPPAAAPLSGFSFIEFAVDETLAVELGRWLEHLGFRLAGRHRSKQVTLYTQGAIRMIVNAQADSFARSRFESHGPSVCALGLGTSDPARAAARAKALLSARFDSPRGQQELQLPAIVAPGGSHIHFVPDGVEAARFEDIDFVPVDSADNGQAQLTQVDHIALGMPPDQLDTWVLFCRAVLGLTPGDSLELADPFGLIRTSSVANAERSLRFVLNVSVSQRTRTARTITASGGAGVHHIAFACKDIFAAVEQMRAQGARFVPISPNYYEDLPTRFDLAPDNLRRMKELGILFDRSTDGDYLHLYTESFADRFFFELVQRVDRYDAYGALNAPARMAAQAQARAEP